MKQIKFSATCALIALTLFSTAFISHNYVSGTRPETTAKNQGHSGNGFAVLELFTSEGCSSCPPAEELLARLQKDAGDKPVYLLAYHVDYWDRLGWKDIFSKPSFSARQYEYSRQLSSQVYTPQLVVNGRTECIGADESAVSNLLGEALGRTPDIDLRIKGTIGSGRLHFDYQLSKRAGKDQLLIAFVQKHAVSKVERGENEGRTLSHARIVRDLQSFDLRSAVHEKGETNGTGEANLPAGFTSSDWECIAMIQNTSTGAIRAATRVPVA